MKKIETEIIIDAPVTTVWQVLTDFERHPTWNPFIKAIAGQKRTLLINLFMGLGIGQSLFGITGIVILYAVLQIKAGKTSAWEELE